MLFQFQILYYNTKAFKQFKKLIDDFDGNFEAENIISARSRIVQRPLDDNFYVGVSPKYKKGRFVQVDLVRFQGTS